MCSKMETPVCSGAFSQFLHLLSSPKAWSIFWLRSKKIATIALLAGNFCSEVGTFLPDDPDLCILKLKNQELNHLIPWMNFYYFTILTLKIAQLYSSVLLEP